MRFLLDSIPDDRFDLLIHERFQRLHLLGGA